MRLCVRWLHVCAGEEKCTLRKSAFCVRALTEKRILCRRRHLDITEKRILRAGLTKGRTLRAGLVAPRGHFRRSVYTHAHPRLLARPGGSMDPSTPTAPWPRNARALGPEAHATGTVTQPSTHTSSRSLIRFRFFDIFLKGIVIHPRSPPSCYLTLSPRHSLSP